MLPNGVRLVIAGDGFGGVEGVEGAWMSGRRAIDMLFL